MPDFSSTHNTTARLGRVVVEPDHVDDLVHELRIGGQLEEVLHVRLELETPPDPPDRRRRQPGARGHRGPGPVRGVRRGLLQRGDHHVLDLVEQDRRADGRGAARRPARRAGGRRTGPASGSPSPASPATGPPPRCSTSPSAQASTIFDRSANACAVIRPPRPPGQLLPLGVGQHQLRPSAAPTAGRRPARHTAPGRTASARRPPSSWSHPTRRRAARTPRPGSAHASTIFARTANRADRPRPPTAAAAPARRRSTRTRPQHAHHGTSQNHSNIDREFRARH